MATSMILDAFLLCDELDMLATRLDLLAPVVDRFVIVEANRTFQGARKPYAYDRNRYRFTRHADKIVRLPADLSSLDGASSPWEREHAQREVLLNAVRCCSPKPDDLVFVSDVDEVWQWDGVTMPDPFLVFEQTMYVYGFQWQHPEPWYGTVAVRYGDLAKMPNPMQTVRSARLHPKPRRHPDGGWHLSWFGGPRANVAKLRSFAHTELAGIAPALRDGQFVRNGIHVDGTPLVPAEPPAWAVVVA